MSKKNKNDLDPILTSLSMVKPPNITLFGIRSLDDYQTLPTLFAAMDLFCYTAALGTPLSLVLEALNCGIAPVVIGGEHLPEELGDTGLLIPSAVDQFGNPELSIEKLEAAFTDLLSNSSELQKREVAARKQHFASPGRRRRRKFCNYFDSKSFWIYSEAKRETLTGLKC